MNWQIIVGAILFIGGIVNIATDFGAFLFGVLIGAVLILWGVKKKGLLQKFKQGKNSPRNLSEETFRAVGISYYENNIRKLEYNNPKWMRSAAAIVQDGDAGKKIFKCNYVNKPVKLVAENNSHDKNAVAVYFAGELVGYIGKEENIHVRDILQNREIISISGFIGGGEYKVISENMDMMTGEFGFSVTVKIKYL